MTYKKGAKQLWCSSLGLVFAIAMTAANAGAASTLDALWHMDGSAITVADSSGNANTGTGTNTVSTAGKFNNSLRFNGASAYVRVPDSATVEQPSDFTVEAWIWVNPLDTIPTEQELVAKWDYQFDLNGTGSQAELAYILAILPGGRVGGSISQTGQEDATFQSVTGVTPVSKGVWHHVAFVYNHNDTTICLVAPRHTGCEVAPLVVGVPTLKIYLDGVLDNFNIVTDTAVYPATDIPVTIGARNDHSPSDATTDYIHFFYGNIDEVREWGRVLADNEILASAQSGLRGDWHFDTSVSGVTPDSSGYSNNATLTGSVLGGSGPEPWFGKSLPLNGTTNYATVADNSTVEIAGSLSLDAWINPTTVSPEFQTVVARGYYSGAFAYSLYLYENQICMDFEDTAPIPNEDYTCGGSVSTGTWHHVAGVADFNAQELYVYLDGVQVGSVAFFTSYPVNLAPGTNLTIGALPSGVSEITEAFAGSIDEVHLWARALSGNEVAFLAGNCSGSVPVRPTGPLDSLPPCAAELIVPLDMTQQIGSSDAEVVPETYFQYAATSEAAPAHAQSKPKPGGGGPEHAMPLWFMVSDPSTTTASPSNPCALDIGSTPGDPKNHIGGLLGCQASADGKSALISGDQINVQTAAKKPPQPATTLHLEVTTSDSDKLPVNVQWR